MGMIAHLEVLGSVDVSKLVTAMKQGGYVIVLRHGATNANQADTDPFHKDNSRSVLARKEIAEGDSFRSESRWKSYSAINRH